MGRFKQKWPCFILMCLIPILLFPLSANQHPYSVKADKHERSGCSNRCPGEESKAIAYTDMEGNEYYEYLSSSIENLDQTDVNAGNGFGFKVTTAYTNEWFESSEVDGPTKVIAHFPSADTGLPKEIELVAVKEPGTWDNVWELPTIYVEKFSGNLFYDQDADNRDLEDELLDGGKKWYTSFTDTDGEYEIYIEIVGAGNTNLTDCQTICINITGSAFDSLAIRKVIPDYPFPSGTGENWLEYKSLITELRGWYYDDSPSGQSFNVNNTWAN